MLRSKREVRGFRTLVQKIRNYFTNYNFITRWFGKYGSLWYFLGIQTFFLSKIFGYLIRIMIYSIDNSLLDHEIFLTFFLGLNIIDAISFGVVIIFQTLLFSIGIQHNKKLINYSAILVYAGMVTFFLDGDGFSRNVMS